MSETVQYRGELTKIEVPEKCDTLEKQAAYLREIGLDAIFYDDYVESKQCICVFDTWYLFTKEGGDDDEDIFEATKQLDGKIKYIVKYYTGGCCFEEAIEEAIKRMMDDKKPIIG